MGNIVGKSNIIILRKTQEVDLNFVVNSEREPINSQYVGHWTKEQHLNALAEKDILHLIVEDAITYKEVGYVIMAGLENLDHNIEFRRIVISDKGKGFGRETLKIVKKIVFNQLNGHRLWLDVREKNRKAQNLYQSVGFIKEGILRECISYNEQFESLMVMSILENEFRRSFE